MGRLSQLSLGFLFVFCRKIHFIRFGFDQSYLQNTSVPYYPVTRCSKKYTDRRTVERKMYFCLYRHTAGKSGLGLVFVTENLLRVQSLYPMYRVSLYTFSLLTARSMLNPVNKPYRRSSMVQHACCCLTIMYVYLVCLQMAQVGAIHFPTLAFGECASRHQQKLQQYSLGYHVPKHGCYVVDAIN